MSAAANRGKFAEGKVRDFLRAWASEHINFCYNRINDARSALGAMSNPQPGDFQWFLRLDVIVGDAFERTRNGLIEVKEVAHAKLLPFKNFSIDQVGRMRIRQLAGSEPLVLVCHRMEGHKPVWRAPDFEYMMVREPGRGSWDLSHFEAQPLNVILENYLR